MLYQIATHLGITQALGYGKNALLALWLIMARLIDQGSRLAAVRLAQNHAVAEILNLNAFKKMISIKHLIGYMSIKKK